MDNPTPFNPGTPDQQRQWAGRAEVLMEQGVLEITARRRYSDVVTAQGQCPACEHTFIFEHASSGMLPDGGLAGGSGLHLTIPREFATTSPAPSDPLEPEYKEFDIACRCTEAHPGRSAAASGCGCVFRLDVLIVNFP